MFVFVCLCVCVLVRVCVYACVCARATHVICDVKGPQVDQIAHKWREGGELVALQAEVCE